MKKGIYIAYLKKANINTCHRTTFDSVFNMSSNYKNDFPKITQIK